MLINFCMVLPIMFGTDYSYFVQCPLHQKQQIIICYPLSDHLLSSYIARKAPVRSVHIGNWFVHIATAANGFQICTPAVLLITFGNHYEMNSISKTSFQILYSHIATSHAHNVYTLHTNLILWKLHTICIPCVYHVIYSQLPFVHSQLPQNFV